MFVRGIQYTQSVVTLPKSILDKLVIWINANMKRDDNYLVAVSTNVAQPMADLMPGEKTPSLLISYSKGIISETNKLVRFMNEDGVPLMLIWYKIFKSESLDSNIVGKSLHVSRKGGAKVYTDLYSIHLCMPLMALDGLSVEDRMS